MPRKAKRFSDEDQAFLQSQADAIGCDVDTYLCMVVRQMRLGQLPTLAFGMAGNSQTPPSAGRIIERMLDQDLRQRLQPELAAPVFPADMENWGAPAPLPEQNAPADEFNFHTAEPVQPQQNEASLVDEIARIAAGVAQDSSIPVRTSPAPSNNVSSLRRSLKASTAPQLSGPPGAATRIVGVNHSLAMDQQGDGRGNVQRQNFRHMYGR